MNSENMKKGLFILCLLVCMLPMVNTAVGLMGGIIFSLFLGNPWPAKSAKFSKIILQISVVGLGFGLSLKQLIHTGKQSFVFTIVGITLTLAIGYLLGRMYKTSKNTSLLISFGTAICGGSAIAAMAPVIKSKDEETAVALATVFTLNAAGLLLFPLIGHALSMNQTLFGTWAALAIHDTSSVVGATAAYGAQALAVGTTVKLTRALWITPVVLVVAWMNDSSQKPSVPLFIIGFVLAAVIGTLLPQFADLWRFLVAIAKQSLVVTLFLIGSGLTRAVLQKVGVRPLLQAVTLWALVSVISLSALFLIGLS
jgi:uncharacterized integral membrane protein (TIGR00698 family)